MPDHSSRAHVNAASSSRPLTLTALVAPCALLSAPAHAQLGPTLCAMIDNNIGILSAIASLGVITLGIAATLGKVTWTKAILIALGISVLFGFAGIVHELTAPTFYSATEAIAARCPGWR